jgi:hypothetical protein
MTSMAVGEGGGGLVSRGDKSFFFSGAFTKLRKATVGFVMSVRPSAWNSSAHTGRSLIKFGI